MFTTPFPQPNELIFDCICNNIGRGNSLLRVQVVAGRHLSSRAPPGLQIRQAWVVDAQQSHVHPPSWRCESSRREWLFCLRRQRELVGKRVVRVACCVSRAPLFFVYSPLLFFLATDHAPFVFFSNRLCTFYFFCSNRLCTFCFFFQQPTMHLLFFFSDRSCNAGG